jgi:hypothetical protein
MSTGIRLPGQMGVIESRKALMDQIVAQQFAAIATAQPSPTATLEQRVRRPMPGDAGKPLQPVRLP